MGKKEFQVQGMTCASCQIAVTRAVESLEGVEKADVSLMTNSMQVSYDPKLLGEEEIEKAVAKAGYQAFHKDKQKKEKKKNLFEEEAKKLSLRLKISIPLLLVLMYFSMGSMIGAPIPRFLQGAEGASNFALLQLCITSPILFVNREFFIKGTKALINFTPNMDSLVSLGALASFFYGIFALFRMNYGYGFGRMELIHHYMHQLYFEGAAMIVTLISLGKYFETRSKLRTTDSIEKLMDLRPEEARVLVDGKEVILAIEEIQVGDTLLVKPGERLALDGLILSGESYIDEASISGESIPVFKKKGDKVVGGTMNQSGSFLYQATAVGEETTLAQIIQLVKDANSSKVPIQSLADKISGIFVPVVIGLSIITLLVWLFLGEDLEFSLGLAISVLVISCPCALGLATPVVVMVSTGLAAEHGLLLKSAEVIETLQGVDTVALDKTGTLTEGKPHLSRIVLKEGLEKNSFLQMVASLESLSDHPLSKAVVSSYQGELFTIEGFQDIPGRGIEGFVGQKKSKLMVGNEAFMKENQIDLAGFHEKAEHLAEEGNTPIYVAMEGKIGGLLAVADILKPTSKEAIHSLKERNLKTLMLSGDHKKTAKAIANHLGVDDYEAELMPQDKEAFIGKIQEEGKQVLMIGDGINDAPALAKARVGVAIGAGTDVAMDSADVILVRSDLQDMISLFDLSKKSMRKIRQNYFWAFIYNILCIPLAAGVFYPSFGLRLNPMIAAAAMSLSSIFVVFNALSLRSFSIKRMARQEIQEEDGAYHVEYLGKEYEESDQRVEERFEKVNKEEKKMKKKMIIEGMSCAHCQMRVEKALNAIDGVSSKVSLEENAAYISLDKEVSDDLLIKAVEDAGYTCKEILQLN